MLGEFQPGMCRTACPKNIRGPLEECIPFEGCVSVRFLKTRPILGASYPDSLELSRYEQLPAFAGKLMKVPAPHHGFMASPVDTPFVQRRCGGTALCHPSQIAYVHVDVVRHAPIPYRHVDTRGQSDDLLNGSGCGTSTTRFLRGQSNLSAMGPASKFYFLPRV
ncbi:hypothetical protein BV22DRAFT_418780 [Leucogyrophana mollusca]|uniref:Uncharacterized protein n=1 Tax=Leucogyrophana mollusca TaxID=85980 RepID=A0ACB8BLG1_9AGAM|nr:hypothetical protein BV22DRAFT_418780 [Leucogyrophana mollusca]